MLSSFYLRERERVSEGDGGEEQRDRGKRRSQADSLLSEEPNRGLDLRTLRS